MRVLVLSARPDLEVNARFAAAAAERGLDLDIVDGVRAVAVLGKALGLTSDGRNLLDPPPQAVIARVGNWRPESLLAALEVAEGAGISTPNPAAGIRTARDQWRTLVALSEAGLPVPETLAGADPESLAAAAGRALGFPVVVKQRRSRMGVGVIRCEALDHLEAVLDSLWRAGDEVLVQRFVPSAGVSLRLLVVGGRVVAAARFRAAAGEWRSNGARGGCPEPHRPSDRETALAVAAAEVAGLGICGVDLLPCGDQSLVCEVNPTPGFLKVERATGIDVAGIFLDYAARVRPATSPKRS